jgi:hypothetical protein
VALTVGIAKGVADLPIAFFVLAVERRTYMSLGIVFKGTQGVVLAADSRVTLFAGVPNPGSGQQIAVPATFDNASKMLRVKGQDFIGAITYGAGALGTAEPRTASSYMPEFEAELAAEERMTVEAFAEKLGAFFERQWSQNNMPPSPLLADNMIFLVGGYDDPSATYGKVFEVDVPSRPKPTELIAGHFGAVWGGQRELIDRLIQGFDFRLPEAVKDILQVGTDARSVGLDQELKNRFTLPIPWQFLPLQDCVDLSIFLVRLTIELQKWIVGIRGVGGAVDVATITRVDGFKEVQVKQITGERRG